MKKPNGLGWKLVLLSIPSAIVLTLLAKWMHLSNVSQGIILIIMLFVPMLLGFMIIYENRNGRRSENSEWYHVENTTGWR